MGLSKEELNIIKESLLYGSVNDIVSLSGVSRQAVWAFMYGKTRSNILIENAILEIYKRDKKIISDQKDRINKIING